jgi:hypothetical protein
MPCPRWSADTFGSTLASWPRLACVRRKTWKFTQPRPIGSNLALILGEARNRHARLLTNAGHAMLSDSMVAMEDLISRGEK